MPGVADLISQLAGGGVQQAPQKQSQPGFPGWVEITNGDADYNTEAEVYGAIGAAGVETIIWEMTVNAQEELAWGYGVPERPANQGYMWFAMMDEGTDWSIGTLRLAQQKARRLLTIIVQEMADSQLHSVTVTTTETAALLNKEEMIALPEQVDFPLVGEDSYLQLRYILTTAATAADAAAFRIPITRYQ